MTKPPLSPFLLDPTNDPFEDPAPSGTPFGAPVPECGDHPVPPGARATQDLDAAELFVIAALRAWVAPFMRPGEAHPNWRDPFHLAAVDDSVAAAFERMMSIIGAQARRLIDVHCCRCPSLGEDEDNMLRLLRALQQGETRAAVTVLADWLPGEAVWPALDLARHLALGMQAAGLSLPGGARVIAFPQRRTLH